MSPSSFRADALRQSRLPGNPFGLPPLSEILSFDPEARAKALRRDFERTKQAASAAARVRTVDAQGRAYATGKRKEAIAKVWLWPAPGGFGTGGFLVNRRPLDVYFPVMSMRAHLLYPLVVTGSLGNVCGRVDVSGGGPSGQAQAARHGVAKALQAWCVEGGGLAGTCVASLSHSLLLGLCPRLVSMCARRDPDLRPPLKAAGLLTRDSRVVERKKPGKRKARRGRGRTPPGLMALPLLPRPPPHRALAPNTHYRHPCLVPIAAQARASYQWVKR